MKRLVSKKTKRILVKLEKQKIDVDKAYRKLYKQKKAKKAHFIRLKIKTNESKGVDGLLAFLFLLPIPIGLITVFLRDTNFRDSGLRARDVKLMLKSKGVAINIKEHNGTIVKIKTI